MSRDKCILVCGIGEAASATARWLYAEGYVVSLFRSTAPLILRRRMTFADAWYDGYALLDGVEARRADVSAEFQLGLRTREFIPLLRGRFADALERWPWDVIVAAHEDKEPQPIFSRQHTELTIGLGDGFTAGVDCDLVVETEDLDPGAILREGQAPQRRRTLSAGAEPDHCGVGAPAAGLFRANVSIGASVAAGEALGMIGDIPILAPVEGRIRGVARKEQAVVENAPVAEIALSKSAKVAGVSNHNQLVSRGVAFAIEMESEGFEPFSLQDWM